MTLDPRWSFFLGLFISIMGYVVGIGGLLTDAGLDPVTGKHVLAYSAIAFGLLNTINTTLSAVPSKPNSTGFYLGPTKPTDPAVKP